MKVNLSGLGLLMIILGALVLTLGHQFPGNWIYAVILIAYGAWLFVKYRKKK